MREDEDNIQVMRWIEIVIKKRAKSREKTEGKQINR